MRDSRQNSTNLFFKKDKRMNYSDITTLLQTGKYDTLLLDRDGVINVLRPNDYVKSWEEFIFIPSFLEAIPQWSQLVSRIVIVTNQRGVAKGLFTEEALNDIHQRMVEEIQQTGGRIDRIYYCTALSKDDPNRKPQPGLFKQLQKEFPETDPQRCLMIGDMPSDMEFAQNCGIEGILISED